MTDLTTAIPELYRLVQEENWVKVSQRVQDDKATEANFVAPATGLTPLHLAIICRKTVNPKARLAAIQALLQAAPQSSQVKTVSNGFTPLHYAVQVVGESSLTSMDDDLAIVQMILEMNPPAATVLNHEGLSPLDVHIIAVSKVKRQDASGSNSASGTGSGSSSSGKRGNKGLGVGVGGKSKGSSQMPTGILKALLNHDLQPHVPMSSFSSSASVTSYSGHNNNNNSNATNAALAAGISIAKPLEILLECNSLAVLEQVALEEAQASSSKLRARRQARAKGITLLTNSIGSDLMSVHSGVGSTNFATFWVWEWALWLLKSDHARRQKAGHHHHHSPPSLSLKKSHGASSSSTTTTAPFQAMHAAAQVKDCPVAFLLLSMRAYPQQVRTPDPVTGNLPLHSVAGWDVTDPASVSRKSMALSALVNEYPQASKVRNKQGKTPLSLALETGTSWDNGVRRLTSFQREASFRNATTTSSSMSRQASYAARSHDG